MTRSVLINSLKLERFILGELPEADRLEVEKAVFADPFLQKTVDDLRKSNAEFHERGPGSALSAAIRRGSLPETAPGPARRRLVLAASLGLSGLVLAFGLSHGVKEAEVGPEVTRIKGSLSALRVFRKTANSSEALGSGDRAARGDLVRLGYQTPLRRFGMIVSIDGRNSVTRHWPVSGPMSAPLVPGELVLLDQAFELDDAPDFERFYLITSDHAFATDLVLTALRSGRSAGSAHALALPDGFEQVSVELQKETSR